jgi:hypothetical protein
MCGKSCILYRLKNKRFLVVHALRPSLESPSYYNFRTTRMYCYYFSNYIHIPFEHYFSKCLKLLINFRTVTGNSFQSVLSNFIALCLLLSILSSPRKLWSVSIPIFSSKPFSTLRFLSQYCQINGCGWNVSVPKIYMHSLFFIWNLFSWLQVGKNWLFFSWNTNTCMLRIHQLCYNEILILIFNVQYRWVVFVSGIRFN